VSNLSEAQVFWVGNNLKIGASNGTILALVSISCTDLILSFSTCPNEQIEVKVRNEINMKFSVFIKIHYLIFMLSY
jgi:hypothetical protein